MIKTTVYAEENKMERDFSQSMHLFYFLRCLTVILIICQSPAQELGCEIQIIDSESPLGHSKDGDVIIAGVLQILMANGKHQPDFTETPTSDCCMGPSFQFLKHFLAFIYAIEEINNRNDVLPNVTLGFQIYDSCTSENLAVKSALKIISETPEPAPNYICDKSDKTVAVVGHLLPSVTYSIVRLTHLYGYPQISYGTCQSVFKDQSIYPSLFHMGPSENSQIHCIIQLLIHFKWTWVGIITSDDDSTQRASIELKMKMGKSGICADFLTSISQNPKEIEKSCYKVLKIIKASTTKVIIFYCSAMLLVGFLETRSPGLTGKVWIYSLGMDSIIDYHFANFAYKFNGSLIIMVHKGEIPGFQTFLYNATKVNMPSNEFVNTFWCFGLGCLNVCGKFNSSSEYDIAWKKRVSEDGTNIYHISYLIYNAVYLISTVLHHLSSGRSLCGPSAKMTQRLRFELNHYLKNMHQDPSFGKYILFHEEGFLKTNFDILNWIVDSNMKIKSVLVGNLSSSVSQQLTINDSAIVWNPHFNETPGSVCSVPCFSGYRKALQIGKLSCCFDCVPCDNGEITNGTAMEICETCPDDEWSNPSRDQCIKRPLHFLSYEDDLGTTLAAASTFLAAIATSVLWLFVKHRNTPLVRANNYRLSYVLLVSLLMCFLLSFLFIGHPKEVTCLLRQTTFGVMFAVAISTVLGKTITVIIAFNATKPGSRLKKCLGPKMSVWLVIICSLGELVICLIWLMSAPPYVDLDTKTIPGEMIVQCNEGSGVAFYFALSYIGVLAMFSFIIAFVSRNLPQTFNEAQYITFSMLVFCSVWISFIPTYLCANGKYMVAVEIFAILASNGALLGFIFLPKCYIILLKPGLNRRGDITVKVAYCS